MTPARTPLVGPGLLPVFALVTLLFFSWALANSLNDVLVRHFRLSLRLSRAEAGLVQSAFYFGYFVAALPAGWVMRRFGYKAGILVGLALYAAGALLFWPAAEIRAYGLFLAALTIIALGLACLETAANPYITLLGDSRTGPARLNLAQAFNGLGAVVGPAIGGLLILSDAAPLRDGPGSAAALAEQARAVQQPYLGLALFVLLLAALIARARMPTLVAGVTTGAAERASGVTAALSHPHLVAAIAAQFAYVAAQVCIWSYFIDFGREQLPGLPDPRLALILSSSIALLMIGRFLGPVVMRAMPAPALLATCAAANVVLCGIATGTHGWTAVGAIWLTSLFMSIMFPTIFALGVADLGPATKIASSLLVMAIVGGAVLPPLMGLAGDAAGGLGPAFVVPLLCFVVVMWFGLAGWRLGKGRTPQQACGQGVGS